MSPRRSARSATTSWSPTTTSSATRSHSESSDRTGNASATRPNIAPAASNASSKRSATPSPSTSSTNHKQNRPPEPRQPNRAPADLASARTTLPKRGRQRGDHRSATGESDSDGGVRAAVVVALRSMEGAKRGPHRAMRICATPFAVPSVVSLASAVGLAGAWVRRNRGEEWLDDGKDVIGVDQATDVADPGQCDRRASGIASTTGTVTRSASSNSPRTTNVGMSKVPGVTRLSQS